MERNRLAVQWVSLGHMDYDRALEIQTSRNKALLDGEDDIQTIYTVEHPPTITIGRNGSSENIVASEDYLKAQGFEVRCVDRGGDVTYHGPGQLVVYPVLHLAPWDNDVRLYVRNMEDIVIRALAEVGITADRAEGLPGVWVGDRKICAVGARVKRRTSGEYTTYHGIALNVNTDLSHFQTIVPCGIQDKGVTSIAEELGLEVSFSEWEERVRRHAAEIFNAEMVDTTEASLN